MMDRSRGLVGWSVSGGSSYLKGSSEVFADQFPDRFPTIEILIPMIGLKKKDIPE